MLFRDSIHATRRVESGKQGVVLGSVTELPDATTEHAGVTVVYLGDGPQEKGALYRCDGTKWELVARASAVDIEVVDSLPDASTAKKDTIYSAPASNPALNNAREEWYVLDGQWELIGTKGVLKKSYTIKVTGAGTLSGLKVTIISDEEAIERITDENGECEVELKVGARYTISVEPASGFIMSDPQTIVVDSAEESIITFNQYRFSTVTVFVKDNASKGNEVGRTVNLISDSGLDVQTAVTDAEGKARFTARSVDEYTITTDVPEGLYIPASPVTQMVLLNEDYEVNIEINSLCAVIVTVVDNSGNGGERGVAIEFSADEFGTVHYTGDDGKLTYIHRRSAWSVFSITVPEHYLASVTSVEIPPASLNMIYEYTIYLDRYPLINVTIVGNYNSSVLRFAVNGVAESPDEAIVDGKVSRFVNQADVEYVISMIGNLGNYHCHKAYVTTEMNKTYEVTMEVVQHFIWGYTIDESVSDPFENVTYLYDNATFRPMRMTGTIFSEGDWAGCPILENIRPCIISNGGAKKTYLNRRDITKTEDGEVASTTLGDDYMVEFPKTAVHVSKEGDLLTVLFTDLPLDEAKERTGKEFSYWNFQWDGTVYDHFYMGQFLALNDSSKIYSQPNSTPTASVSLTNFINYCKARGSGYDVGMWNKYDYISALFVLFFKSTQGQLALAGGLTSGSKTDNLVISYDNDYGMAGNSDNTSAARQVRMSFLWINDYWGNLEQWMGGMGTDSSRNMWYSDVSTTTRPTDTTESHGIVENDLTSNISGYVTKEQGNKFGIFFPLATGGSTTTKYCDYGFVYSSSFPNFGGDYSYGTYAGPFYVTVWYSATSSYSRFGARLLFSGSPTQ